MRVKTPKSFNNGSATPKPSQEKAELAAAQSAGDEAASILESAEANILPFEPDPDKGSQPVDEQPVSDSAVSAQPVDEPEATDRPITSEAEPGKATVDAGEVVKFQSVADGYRPRATTASDGPAEPAKPAHVLMYERCLADAKEAHFQAAIAREQLQGELKSAKEDEKAALKLVSKIIAGGPERYLPPPPKKNEPKSENTAGGDQGITSPGEGRLDTDTPPAANTSDAWRSAPLTELSLPKKGSINRLLKDGIETMGQFEDRRVAVAEGKGEWPKFFGPEKLTLVEEAFLNWLEANRDVWQVPQAAPAETAATPDVAQEPITDTPDTAPAAEPSAEQPANTAYPDATTWESWTEKQQTKWIEARAEQLAETIRTGKDETPEEFQMTWNEGAEAFIQEDRLENCPFAPGRVMDAWICGWLGSQAVEAGENAEPELAAVTGGPTRAATKSLASHASGSQLFDLDDL